MSRLLNRSLQLPAVVAPVLPITGWSMPRLRPLWTHAVWIGALFAVALLAVNVRLDVAELNRSLERNYQLQREAKVLHERLALELDTRRRVAALEQRAVALGIQSDVPLVSP